MNLIKKLTLTLLTASIIANSTACNTEPTNESILLGELRNDSNDNYTDLTSFIVETDNNQDLLKISCEKFHMPVYNTMYNGFTTTMILVKPSYTEKFMLTYYLTDEEVKKLPFEKNIEINFNSLTDEDYQLLINLVKDLNNPNVKELD